MKALLAVLALSLAAASCAQTGKRNNSAAASGGSTSCNGPVGDQCTDSSGAGSSVPGGRADGQPGLYGPAAPAKAD
jgi:hypothetical protein